MVAQINRLRQKFNFKQLICLFGMLFYAVKAFAEPILLSDDETETLLENIVRPIFNVAGVTYDPNKIHLLDDMSLNAFVSDGNNLFVNVGTLMAADNVNEISGILAHETGHIAGGHILRQKLKINDLKFLSAMSLLAAGATAVASGRGDVAMAMALGSHGSLINAMLAYQMTEERSADESAVKYLKELGQSPAGLKNFMKTIQKNNRTSGIDETPYFTTHPMNAERTAFFEKATKDNGGRVSSPLDTDLKFVQAKLSAFLLPPERANIRYPKTDRSLPAKYAHAIVKFKENKLSEALSLLNDLIESKPNNPYFYQLKGQFLFERGKIKEATATFEKALELKPDSNETMLMYAESALEEDGQTKNLQDIIDVLNKLQIRKETPRGWELLSRAYHEKGNDAESLYAAAKYSFLIGNVDVAKKQIKKASSLKTSESLKLRLSDLENQIENEQDE